MYVYKVAITMQIVTGLDESTKQWQKSRPTPSYSIFFLCAARQSFHSLSPFVDLIFWCVTNTSVNRDNLNRQIPSFLYCLTR